MKHPYIIKGVIGHVTCRFPIATMKRCYGNSARSKNQRKLVVVKRSLLTPNTQTDINIPVSDDSDVIACRSRRGSTAHLHQISPEVITGWHGGELGSSRKKRSKELAGMVPPGLMSTDQTQQLPMITARLSLSLRSSAGNRKSLTLKRLGGGWFPGNRITNKRGVARRPVLILYVSQTKIRRLLELGGFSGDDVHHNCATSECGAHFHQTGWNSISMRIPMAYLLKHHKDTILGCEGQYNAEK